MITSEAVDLISAALVELQAEICNVKATSTNPFYDSRFANLATIINETRPLLSKHGLALIQGCEHNCLATRLIHKSGQFIESSLDLSVPKWSNPQDVGKAMTYARRYEQAAMLNIAQEDDDGQSLANKSDKVEYITSAQAFDIQESVNQIGGDVDKFCHALGVKQVADITTEILPKATALINKKRKAVDNKK